MQVIAVPELEALDLPAGWHVTHVPLQAMGATLAEKPTNLVLVDATALTDGKAQWLSEIRTADARIAVVVAVAKSSPATEATALWLGLDGVWVTTDGVAALRGIVRREARSATTRSVVALGDVVADIQPRRGIAVRCVADEASALRALRLPGVFALLVDPAGRDVRRLVDAVQRYSPAIRVIASVPTERHAEVPPALEQGVSDFLLLPPGPRQLRDVLDRAWAQTGIAGVFARHGRRIEHIVLVEDDETFGHLIGRYIQRGFPDAEVHRMQRLAELPELGFVPDAVLLDLNLPDSHGLETIVLARTVFPAAPILVLTSSDPDIGLFAIACGAHDFFPKAQLDGTWLCNRVRFAVERQRWVVESTAVARDLRARELAWREVVGSLSTPLVMVDRTSHTVAMTRTAADLLELASNDTVMLSVEDVGKDGEVILRPPSGPRWRALRTAQSEITLFELITPVS